MKALLLMTISCAASNSQTTKPAQHAKNSEPRRKTRKSNSENYRPKKLLTPHVKKSASLQVRSRPAPAAA
ncbi:hypothetical protein QEM13_004383 [Pseudomonas putida]|nr:hypothetical protein [Pseudomonas putida]